MSNISSWSTTAASNNSPAPNGAPEGMAPSGVNDVIRENMAATSKFYKDTQGALVTTGSSNTYVLTTNSTHASLAAQSLLTFRANHANTGAATLNVDGLGAKAIRAKGAALSSGEISEDAIYSVAYNSAEDSYDIIGGGTLNVSFANYQAFTADGTWTKPAGAQFVFVEMWAGGAGGVNTTASNTTLGGSSGGEYICGWFQASALGATEAVTVGAGGAGGATGGNNLGAVGENSSFGSHLTAVGGNTSSLNANESATIPRSRSSSSAASGVAFYPFCSFSQAGYGGNASLFINGGDSTYGGGGGGSSNGGAGGVSEYGGDGGAGNNTLNTAAGDGVAPGGAGGASGNNGGGGNGARGEVRAWSF